MFSTTGQPTGASFFYQQPTFYYQSPTFAQARVENDRMLMSPTRSTYVFRTAGWILGILILFFTCVLFASELGRLYSGSNNRSNTNNSYLMYPNENIGSSWNVKIENRWMWPWSTATLLFSLLFFTTGLFGLISGQRENYSTILTFFLCSFISLCLLIFLIANYSTTIAGWRSIYRTSNGNEMSRYDRIDRDLAIVCLSMSCVLFVLNFVSLIVAARSIDLCESKSFHHGEKFLDSSSSQLTY